MVEWCTQNLRQNGSISHGTSHATHKEHYQYTTSMDINNTRYKRIQSLIQNHMPMCAVSLLESREQRYIKVMNNNNNNNRSTCQLGQVAREVLSISLLPFHVVHSRRFPCLVKESVLRICKLTPDTFPSAFVCVCV